MSEKRFNIEYVLGNRAIWHITDCGEHITDEEICDWLNLLNDKNEELKAVNEYLIRLLESIGVTVEIKNIKGDRGMTEKRLIVRDGDYAWIDTTTGYVVEVEDAFDLVNTLHEENVHLKGEVAHYKLILMSLEEVAKRMSSIRRFKND